MSKTFYYRDKSGRGFKFSITLEQILEDEGESFSWDGESLKEWAKEAEEGDEWKDNANHYICTYSE